MGGTGREKKRKDGQGTAEEGTTPIESGLVGKRLGNSAERKHTKINFFPLRGKLSGGRVGQNTFWTQIHRRSIVERGELEGTIRGGEEGYTKIESI